MNTYSINLDGDILKVAFGSTVSTGDQIVRDTAAKLNQMIASGELPGIEDAIESEVPILRGSIHRLERGEDVSSRPMLQALAQGLVGFYRR
jgi:hypothetical protein